MGSKSNYKYICKREVEGDLLIDRREGSVTSEAEIGMMQPQARQYKQLLEAGRGKECHLPQGQQPC